jgi:hypothetical protein
LESVVLLSDILISFVGTHAGMAFLLENGRKISGVPAGEALLLGEHM